MATIDLYTIGFEKKSAEVFFESLKKAGVRHIIDIRLENNSVYDGFTKRTHLPYLLKKIGNIQYHYMPDFAPTRDLMHGWKKGEIPAAEFEKRFQSLIKERSAIDNFDPSLLNDKGCLLCFELSPEHCHRRLVAEMLKKKWRGIQIRHL
jgi:uncharacterized protein (DUF488 family)